MSWVDIVFIALTVLLGALGVLKGVKKSGLALGAFLVAFILAFFLSNAVAEALLNVEGIKRFVLGTDGFSLYTWIDKAIGTDSGFTASEFQNSHFYQPIMDIISKSGTETAQLFPALYIAFTVFSALCGVCLFFVIRLLLVIVTVIIKSYIGRKKSGLGRLFGLILGAARGFLWAFAFTLVFSSIGGLTFASGLQKAEDEFESAVIGRPVYEFAYTVKNKMFLPDWNAYDRILKISGLTVDEGDNTDPDGLIGQRLDTYCDLMNLNYKSGTPYSSGTGELVIDKENAVEIDPSDYIQSGFDKAIKTIIDYNIVAAETVADDSFDVDNVTLSTTYKTAIQTGANSLYNCMNKLIADLYNYELKITNSKDLKEEEAIGKANKELKVLYDSIVETINKIKNNYKSMPAFGTFTVMIPVQYTVSV